ncbi:MAG: Translation initiation factor IF-2 protein [Parcubacteria group bacterium GW2011_GWF2_38_76]|nr:MAG: Translation initiation factor IF-2 protein [Parcubacteria group bacterium GW2011_GWF2_38_76]HBM45797.1 translation initiation factor IF-2 [Patescibacteria group bacterium]
MTNKTQKTETERPPIITVMGHIDHGKSTLLDYIRKANTVEKEAGGITQHTSAYEVMHEMPSGEAKRITFIDTPGHAAFSKMRGRGAQIADVIILVVAADDGVNVQTIEAIKTIQDSGTPYVVAINKIDKPNSDIEKTKLDLASNGVFLEGYGGDVPNVPVSAKTGDGVSDLLDVLLLMAEMGEFKKDDSKPGEGFVFESNLDPKKGGVATLIIKDGTLNVGDFIIIDGNVTPLRSLENFAGKKIAEAIASSPVKITGFSKLPAVGSNFISTKNKKEAEKIAETQAPICARRAEENYENVKLVLPVILKADFQGSVEAIEKELRKLENDDVKIRIISCGVGNITENDVSSAGNKDKPLVIGFNVKADRDVMELGEKLGIKPMTFDIIYKINDTIEEEIKRRMPKEEVEKTLGQARILRVFSRQKDKQVVGGTVLSGSIIVGKEVKIIRQKNEIGRGEINELQENKMKAREVVEGKQFGVTIDSKITIAESDIIEAFDLETI